jgi:hypothetical protein
VELLHERCTGLDIGKKDSAPFNAARPHLGALLFPDSCLVDYFMLRSAHSKHDAAS